MSVFPFHIFCFAEIILLLPERMFAFLSYVDAAITVMVTTADHTNDSCKNSLSTNKDMCEHEHNQFHSS